jgi:DNA modification methylase
MLGLKEVPTITVDLTDEQAKAYRLADNKLNESEWDMSLVIDELKLLSLPMLDLTGFDKDLLIEPGAKDDIIPENVPARSKLGDLYELGAHRVLCGDSTQPEAVLRLMDGKKADMVFTDPPYGMNLDVSNSDNLGGKGKWRNKAKNYSKVIGDDKDYNPTHLFEMFPDVQEMFLWGFDYFAEFIPNRKYGSVIVWDKRKGVEDMKLTFSEFELCWSREKHLREMVRITWSGLLGTEQEFDHKRHHPTQKPRELSKWFLDKYSKDNWLIADLFLGSGSTLIACEKTGRICYGMELDPKYVDVIVQRYVDYTKGGSVKLNGKTIKWPQKTSK